MVEVRPRLPGVPDSTARDLPDLTENLIRAGLYEEYASYKEERQQHHSYGGAGGLTAQRARRQPHELWHPTPQKFEFFFTAAYWAAVSGVIGSMLLVVKSVVVVYVELHQWQLPLVKLIDTAGNLAFTATAYLQYVELINMPEEVERRVYFCPAWGPIRERVTWESIAGTLAFGFSMLLFDVSVLAQYFDVGTGVWQALLLQAPAVLGGLGLCAGGIFEVIHNWHERTAKVARSAAMLDCLGGVGYFIGGVFGISEDPTAVIVCKWCYLGGISVYLLACVLLLVMWRANDFGFLLLRQLNHHITAGHEVTLAPMRGGVVGFRISRQRPRNAQQHGGTAPGAANGEAATIAATHAAGIAASAATSTGSGAAAGTIADTHTNTPPPPPSRANRFGVRGVVLLTIYCWLFTCCLIKCAAHILLMQQDFHNNLGSLVATALWLLVVSAVLFVHSAITSIPDQQPYRLGFVLMRIALSLGALVKTRQLLRTVLAGH